MKVKIQVDHELKEEFVEFHVRNVTEDILKFSEMIEKRDCILSGIDAQDRIVIIHPEDIVAVHAEKKWSRIYTDKLDVSCRKRLYEMNELLGPEFIQISKSILVNARKIESVEAVFNGMMLLHMKNGSKEYVSRIYLPDLKAFLGI